LACVEADYHVSADARLPAQLEVSGLIRQVQADGGFAAVLQRGAEQGGTIMVVLTENGRNTRAYERMPQLNGSRIWHLSRTQAPENPQEFVNYVTRRGDQDSDLWIVELDIANGERFIGLPPLAP
jgi:hypothetical protein